MTQHTPTAQRIAEALDYQRAAARVLTKDTEKGRAEEAARLKELDLTSYALAHVLEQDDSDFNRNDFLRTAGALMQQSSKKRYTVEVTVEVEATQQPDPEDFTFDTSNTAADIGVEVDTVTWNIYEDES